jgi:hypothetical protein
MKPASMLLICAMASACAQRDDATVRDTVAAISDTAFAAPPHPGAPPGVETLDLWVLGSADEAERDTIYRVHRARWSEGGRPAEVMWLEWEYDRPRADGDTTHLVLDRVVVPALATGELLEHTFCRANGEEDRWLFAIVVNDESQQHLTNIRRAWRANRTTRRLEEVPASGIDCFNDDYDV